MERLKEVGFARSDLVHDPLAMLGLESLEDFEGARYADFWAFAHALIVYTQKGMARVFILNPNARQGRLTRDWQAWKRRHLSNQPGGQQEPEHWGPPEELVSQGFDEWVVVGGDGSLQRAIHVLLSAHARGAIQKLPLISVLAMGTGADFVRSLGPVSAGGESVDAGRVVLDGGEPRYFINVASAGFSARVAEAKERMPAWIPRGLAYLVPTLLELPHAAPTQMRLLAPGTRTEGRAWAVFICNGSHAGGGMRFGANARLDDGLFEVTWVEDLPVYGVLLRLPQVYSRLGLVEQKGVRKLDLPALTLEAPAGVTLLMDLDGEPVLAQRAEFAIIPAAATGLRMRRFPEPKS